MSDPIPNVPAEPSTAPHPDGDPPKYMEAFPTPAYPPAGPPHQGQQMPSRPIPEAFPTSAAYPPAGPAQGQQVPGPMPVAGPQQMTTVHYQASGQQVTYVRPTHFSEFPMQSVCPRCQQSITTSTTFVNGLLLWLVVGVICLFGGFLGCCLIPFCVTGCKDVAHTCPQCNEYIGTFKRM